MKKYYIIITISALVNNERTCPVTSAGYVDAETREELIRKSLQIARVTWTYQYKRDHTSVEKFIIDFFNAKKVK